MGCKALIADQNKKPKLQTSASVLEVLRKGDYGQRGLHPFIRQLSNLTTIGGIGSGRDAVDITWQFA